MKESKNTAASTNKEFVDSMESFKLMLDKIDLKDSGKFGNQIIAQAAGLAMLNLVQQQQQQYILQNTITAVAAKSMLESDPAEAVKMMNDVIKNNDFMETFKGIQSLVEEISKSINDLTENTDKVKNKSTI
jgi:hypothetical protein